MIALRAKAVEPAVAAQIRTQPDVDRVVPARDYNVYVPALGRYILVAWY